MKKIEDINEMHNILFDIAKSFHKICVERGIPYYMAYGTLLGAVRHKGFIPWDDDMDFCVPRKYFEKLKVALAEELPHPYELVTAENSDYPISYIKIQNVKTLAVESVMDYTNNYIGINIDIFPLDTCSSHYRDYKFLLWCNIMMGHLINGIFIKLDNGIMRILANKILHNIISSSKRNKLRWLQMKDRIRRRIENTGSDCYINLSSIYKERDIITKDYWEEPILYTFENSQLFGPKNADKILKTLYGDYLELPSSEKRHIHLSNSYFK